MDVTNASSLHVPADRVPVGDVLHILRRQLTGLGAAPDDVPLRGIPPDTEALRLLVDYVRIASQPHMLTSPQLRRLFRTHVHDLVALASVAARDASAVAPGRGLRAARLDAIKRDIAGRLDSERLGITDVARRQRVTPRYVQKLFEEEGTTFSEFVVRQRLALAHRMLTDPGLRNRNISTIAFDAGFESLSYFNRCFRRSYGTTPSDVRAGARSGSA